MYVCGPTYPLVMMKHIVNVVGYFSRLTVVVEGVVCCVFMCEASCVCTCVCVCEFVCLIGPP